MKVIIEGREANRIYNKGYGKFKGNKLYLHPIEACYLIEKGKLEFNLKDFMEDAVKKDKNFEIKYLVYRDLKERGYILSVDKNFNLYKRGARPPAPPEYRVIAVSERDIFSIRKIMKWIEKSSIKVMCGIVDEEGDITYYTIKFFHMKGKSNPKEYDGSISLLRDRSMVWEENLAKIMREEFMGRAFGKFLLLSLMETAYALKRGASVIKNGNIMNFEEFMDYAKKIQPDIEERLEIYNDMKNKGLIPKTGFKFGSHFRVYDDLPDKSHAPYLVHVVKNNFRCSWAEISRAVRLAHSVKKDMIFGVVGDDIKYIRIKRITP